MKANLQTVKLVTSALCILLIILLTTRIYLLNYLNVNEAAFVRQSIHTRRLWKHAGCGSTSNLHDWNFNITRACEFTETVLEADVVNDSVTKFGSNIANNKKGAAATLLFGGKPLERLVSTCIDDQPVPNVFHYVWMYSNELEIFHFLSLLSIIRFQTPCLIVIHGPTTPTGRYFDMILSMHPRVVHALRSVPSHVGRNRLAFPEHSSDVMRIEALLTYGGIYMDFDVILLQSVEHLRSYPYTQGFESPTRLGSQVIMAQKDAPFLHHWLESYGSDYHQEWGYNALVKPYLLSQKYPKLIHVEGYKFAKPSWGDRELIYSGHYNWSDNYAIHLYTRELSQSLFDVEMLSKLNTTLGAVWRHVFYGNKELCS